MTQEEIYKRSCDQMEVVKVSYFLRNMYSEVMNLAHHQLGLRKLYFGDRNPIFVDFTPYICV